MKRAYADRPPMERVTHDLTCSGLTSSEPHSEELPYNSGLTGPLCTRPVRQDRAFRVDAARLVAGSRA